MQDNITVSLLEKGADILLACKNKDKIAVLAMPTHFSNPSDYFQTQTEIIKKMHPKAQIAFFAHNIDYGEKGFSFFLEN